MHLRPLFALVVSCTALGLAACSSEAPSEAHGHAAPRIAALQVGSDLSDYAFVAMRHLPRSPENGVLDEGCTGYRTEKPSPLAKSVERLGWIVTSEAPLGRYRVITFASGFDPGTSALCFARNANLAVFDGEALVALAYAKHPYRGPDDPANPVPLGRVELLEDATGLLVWTDPPGVPVGELRLVSQGLRLTARSPHHTYCQGLAVVPDIYGKPIADARRMLLEQGWRPRRPAEQPDAFERALGGADVDTPELESCSGTGVGYCAWNYSGKAAALGVVTVGEDHTVSSYGVTCKER